MKETIEDKKFIAASVYLNLYLNSLEEIVNDNGGIYLSESDDRYAKVCIFKKDSECLVDWSFWYKFSKEFSLQESELKLLITKWIGDTYGLKSIHTFLCLLSKRRWFKIPNS